MYGMRHKHSKLGESYGSEDTKGCFFWLLTGFSKTRTPSAGNS